MAQLKPKRISSWLNEMACEQCANGDPKNKAIAKVLYELALDANQPAKIRLEAIEMIADRTEGRAVQTNLNADVTANPFEGIDTTKLESLKAKLIEANGSK